MDKWIRIVVAIGLIIGAWFAFQSRRSAAVNNRAITLMAEGHHEEAAKLLELTSAKHPGNTRILNNLALAYEEMGETKKAHDALQQSLNLKPDQPAIRERLQDLEPDLLMADKAAARVARMKAEGWTDEPGVTLQDIKDQAEVHVQLGKHKEAIILLERALFRQPHDLEIERVIEYEEAQLAKEEAEGN